MEKKKKWSFVLGIISIICGVYFVLNPSQSFNNIVYYLGLVLISIGVIKLVSHILTENKNSNIKLLSGIINLLFGIILTTYSHATIKAVTILIGLYLILSASSSLSTLIVLSKNKVLSNNDLVKAILRLVAGIIVFTTPVVSIIFTGIVLGILLIIIGIIAIINAFMNKSTYKVKVK